MTRDETSLHQRYDTIVRRLAQDGVLGEDLIKASLLAPGRRPRGLFATSPTGKPHIGYLIPLLKVIDLLDADVEVLLGSLDVYSYLDNVKYPMEQVLQRADFYRFSLLAALEALGVPSSRVRCVREVEWSDDPKFMPDMWRLMQLVPQQDIRETWSDRDVLPTLTAPLMSPLLQTLSEEYLQLDFSMGGTDQRSLFELADKYLPALNYRRRAHLMTHMLPSLLGTKMSSSSPPESKVMLVDDPDTIRKKFQGAIVDKGDKECGLLITFREIIFPLSELWQRKTKEAKESGLLGAADMSAPGICNIRRQIFVAATAPQDVLLSLQSTCPGYYGLKHYRSYAELEEDFTSSKLTADDLKAAAADVIVKVLEPVRRAYQENKEWQRADLFGYGVASSSKA